VSDEEYFEEIADVFGIRETKVNRIRRELVRMVQRSQDEVFVLITDFENDRHLDEFAKLMRAVLDRVGERLRVVTIGGEKLANLKTNMGIHSYFNYFHRHTI
jgi:type II secretory pathway predicted ATPase ExeA